jgi:hypothetical protein
MKLGILIALIAFGFTNSGLGQKVLSADTDGNHFRWSLRKAQELDYRQTIRRSNELTSGEQALLLRAVAAQIRPFKAELEIGSERELQQFAANTRIKLIDLDDDGVAEILAQAKDFEAGCGATGNCPFWVFQRTRAGFKLLFDSRGGQAVGGFQTFTIEPNRTNGFNDLVFGTSEESDGITLVVYRYRNGQYRESACYNANRLSTKGGEFHILKDPVITPCVARVLAKQSQSQ